MCTYTYTLASTSHGVIWHREGDSAEIAEVVKANRPAIVCREEGFSRASCLTLAIKCWEPQYFARWILNWDEPGWPTVVRWRPDTTRNPYV